MNANTCKTLTQKCQGMVIKEHKHNMRRSSMTGIKWCARFMIKYNGEWIRICNRGGGYYTHIEYNDDPGSLTGMSKCSRDDY